MIVLNENASSFQKSGVEITLYHPLMLNFSVERQNLHVTETWKPTQCIFISRTPSKKKFCDVRFPRAKEHRINAGQELENFQLRLTTTV